MFLNPSDIHDNYDSKVIPFIQNGIIIDTSVIDILIEGIISTRISKKESPELEQILRFLELLKVSNKWDKFYITPHILTEVCTHLNNSYNKWENFSKVVKEVMPVLKEMKETTLIEKDAIIEYIDLKRPVVEVGDISIFLTAKDFIGRKQKIAILAKDRELNEKFLDHPRVMVMDYQHVILNML